MSDAYTIEVQSMTVGLVVRERDQFRFFSANAAFAELDGLVFRNPAEAETAAVRHRRLRASDAVVSASVWTDPGKALGAVSKAGRITGRPIGSGRTGR